MKNEILMVMMVLGLISCKKKASPVDVESKTNPCFNSQYNGMYYGYGTSSVNAFTSGTLTLTKTGCESCTMYLTTNTAGSFSHNVTQLVSNSNSGFDGKLSNGNNVSIVLGSHIDVKATGSYTFTGQK